MTIDPGVVIGNLRAGKLTVVQWKSFRSERAIGDWPLAATISEPALV
jgi:hypothetical protein